MTRADRDLGFADAWAGRDPTKADPAYLRGYQLGSDQLAAAIAHQAVVTCDVLHVLEFDPTREDSLKTARCGNPATYLGRVGSDPPDAPPRFPLCAVDAPRWPLPVVKIVDNSVENRVDTGTTGA